MIAAGTVVGLGIDIVDVARLHRVLERRPGMLARLFTTGEVEYARRHGDMTMRLAARYAAKEATMKALGVGLGAFPFTDVEVLTSASGAPSISVTGAARARAKECAVGSWHLSLSHTNTTAVAVALALA